MPPATPSSRSAPPLAAELSHVLADQGLAPADVAALTAEGANQAALLATVTPGELPTPQRLSELREEAARKLSSAGHLLIHLAGRRTDAEFARWRDGIWPTFHVGARYLYESSGDITKVLLQGPSLLHSSTTKSGSIRVGELLCAQRCDHVRSPELTALKFDTNAAAWNGNPTKADYLHHRWMRKFVGRFSPKRPIKRVLDFGCGAGWVGIEACLHQGAEQLRFFDPSPEMVRISTENAHAAGISNAAGATGFGEAPPYPNSEDEAFDLVLSSGVVSFARDREAWYDGLARTVGAGGTLIFGDLNPASRGMRRRRSKRAMLPIRELAAVRRAEARAAMESRGFRHEESCGYQLTDPIPQLLHLDATRLGGALAYPLSWCNRLASSLDRCAGGPFQPLFDSWVMRFVREP
jgi:SAM-dependent methyltransferase